MQFVRRLQRFWWLAVLALLASCGGSEPGKPLVRGLRVSIDGKAVALPSPQAGGAYAFTMDSGAVLEVNTGEPVTVSTDPGGATASVEAEEAQRFRLRLSAPGGAEAAITIAANATPDNPVQLRLRVAPQRFANRIRSAGDVLTYRRTPVGGGASEEYSRNITWVFDDGGYRVTLYNVPFPGIDKVAEGDQGGGRWEGYDADGNYTGWSSYVWSFSEGEFYDDGDGCDWLWVGVAQAFPLYVGKAWRSTVGYCGGTEADETHEQQVLAYETVSVPAGTFATLRRRDDITYSDGSGRVVRSECNWSVDLALNVRCDYSVPDGAGGFRLIETHRAVSLPAR